MRIGWTDVVNARADAASGETVELTGFPMAAGSARQTACFLMLPDAF